MALSSSLKAPEECVFVCQCEQSHQSVVERDMTSCYICPFPPQMRHVGAFLTGFLPFSWALDDAPPQPCFSPEVGLSSLMHAHLVIGCSCWLAISSPLPTTLRNAVRSLTISIVPRMHIVFRSATFNSCNLQQFAARYQLGLRESQLILTVRYAKNVKNKLNFNPSIILNFKKLTRPW